MNASLSAPVRDVDPVVAFTSDGPRRMSCLLSDAKALADWLPDARHVLNVCEDRYRFAVGFVACLLSGRVSLQPASQSAATLESLQRRHPDVLCLHDAPYDSGTIPRLAFPDLDASVNSGSGSGLSLPTDEARHPVAVLFTSGSTGEPQPHAKGWRRLQRNGRVEAERLGLTEGPAWSIVGTVPVQHSYGFESTFLMALQGGAAFAAGRPFYPADIADALNAVPAPRLLVTTPFHLSTLVQSGVELPPLDMVLSATAPLGEELARSAEERYGAPVHEIYGSTESGQLATRRTTDGPEWRLLDGVELTQDADITVASGGHVEGMVPLSDVIELLPERHFRLIGRHADMVNIAGKRTSLAYLTHQLQSIEGVLDGAFFLPDDVEGLGLTRPVAFVHAPALDKAALTRALHERIDPVFMPRPLVWVDGLPRNSTGKVLRSSLVALYEEKVLARRSTPGLVDPSAEDSQQ